MTLDRQWKRDQCGRAGIQIPTPFPEITTRAVRRVRAPALILSGERSYPFLSLIDEALTQLLPANRRIILKGATHQMWYE